MEAILESSPKRYILYNGVEIEDTFARKVGGGRISKLAKFLIFDDFILVVAAISAFIGLNLCATYGIFTPLLRVRTQFLGIEVTIIAIQTGTILAHSGLTFFYFLCTRVAFTLWRGLLRFRWRLRFFTIATIVQSIFLHELLLAFTHWGFNAAHLGVFRDLPEFTAFYTHLYTSIVSGCLLVQVLLIVSIFKGNES